jgi:hypothetical protein
MRFGGKRQHHDLHQSDQGIAPINASYLGNGCFPRNSTASLSHDATFVFCYPDGGWLALGGGV